MMAQMKAPFPWFGGKSRAAGILWPAFGDVANYVEPFAGSLAVLLARPHAPRIETVNDLDAFVANFWRAVQHDPEAVARAADWPVNEADLHARHAWLVGRADFRERMLADPEHYDARVAGWWVWGLCAWIGQGWCSKTTPSRQLIHLGTAGQGMQGQTMRGNVPSRHLGGTGNDHGRGVNGVGVRSALHDTFQALAERLRHTRVACGDWKRILSDSVTWRHGTTAILLDPPYDDGEIDYAAGGRGVSAEVRAWAVEHGDDKRLRIALCGYEGEHGMPESWRCVAWKAKGGYGSQRVDGSNDNAKRERIWLSPGCLGASDGPLFAHVETLTP